MRVIIQVGLYMLLHGVAMFELNALKELINKGWEKALERGLEYSPANPFHEP